jgi:hypothetical protein
VPRLIEIVLFLAPFIGFGVWRLLFPQPLPPVWLMTGLFGFAVLMFVTLLWVRQMDAEDADQPYVPAELHDGRVVTPKP